MKAFLTVVFALLLGACAAPVHTQADIEQAELDLESGPVCCFALANGLILPLERIKDPIALDVKSQVFEFPEGRSHFAVIELPPFVRPYQITLTSIAFGGRDHYVGLFVPVVDVYDASWTKTRSFLPEDLKSRGSNLERTIFINPANSDDRYIVVRSSVMEGSFERADALITASRVSAGRYTFSNVVSGTEARTTVRVSRIGSIGVEVKPN
jgi:hypothetical protein